MSPRPPDARLQRSAPLFAALGDGTRLAIVAQLCARGPLSIARLTETADVTRQAVAKHLAVLENAGLVHGRREGRESIWELEPARLDDVRRTIDAISERWDKALARLRDMVEDR